MLSEGMKTARRMRCLMVAAVLLFACASVLAAGQDDNETRKMALAQLLSPDASERLAACETLAQVGKSDDLPPLHRQLFDGDARVRGMAEAAIWAIWSRSGNPAADRLFERGMDEMRNGNLKVAVEIFGKAIAVMPQFTEAWNKRATIYFLLGEYELSLKDCAEVLRRNPQHFGVLAGYGQIYLRQGDLPRALDYFERAITVNPNMAGVRSSIEAIRETLIKRERRYI